MNNFYLKNFIKINNLHQFKVENIGDLIKLKYQDIVIKIDKNCGIAPIICTLSLNDVKLQKVYDNFDIPLSNQDNRTDLILLNRKQLTDKLIKYLNDDLIRNLFKLETFEFDNIDFNNFNFNIILSNDLKYETYLLDEKIKKIESIFNIIEKEKINLF